MYFYDAFLALVTGFAVGVLFSWLKLPLPAPPALAGVLGVVGLFLGRQAYLEFLSLMGRL